MGRKPLVPPALNPSNHEFTEVGMTGAGLPALLPRTETTFRGEHQVGNSTADGRARDRAVARSPSSGRRPLRRRLRRRLDPIQPNSATVSIVPRVCDLIIFLYSGYHLW